MHVHKVYLLCPPKTETVTEGVQVYVDDMYAKFRGSSKVLSDNGTKFKNQLYTDVAIQQEIEHKIYSPPYHPH